MGADIKTIGSGVLLLLFLAAVSLIYTGAKKSIEKYTPGESWAVTNWLHSAECAKNTHKVLVLCID